MGVELKTNEAFFKSLNRGFDKNEIHVGVFGEESSQKALSAETGVYFDKTKNKRFNAPVRPFISDSFNEAVDSLDSVFNDEMVLSKEFENKIDSIGQKLVIDMQSKIEFSPTYYEGNAPLTIANKGFDHPLIETGEMYNDIGFKIK